MKTNVYIMVGVSGSGKSTLAQELSRRLSGSIVVSSDQIRKEILGDEADQRFQNIVWKELYFQLRDSIQNPLVNDVFVDATNLKSRDRITMINYVRDKGANVSAIQFDEPAAECIKRDAARQRTVGKEAIEKQCNKLEPFSDEEKLDHIYRFNWTKGWEIVK